MSRGCAAKLDGARDPYLRISSLDEMEALVSKTHAVLVFFSSPDCKVCEALAPRVGTLVQNHFPQIQTLAVDCGSLSEVCAKNGVLSVPLVIVYFEGREWLRLERNFSIAGLHAKLDRPYRLLFGDD